MSSGYFALKWQGVRPPGMACCMMVVIMLIKLCCDSLSWWINVARLKRRDGAVIASKKKEKTTHNYICYDSQFTRLVLPLKSAHSSTVVISRKY